VLSPKEPPGVLSIRKSAEKTRLEESKALREKKYTENVVAMPKVIQDYNLGAADEREESLFLLRAFRACAGDSSKGNYELIEKSRAWFGIKV